MGIYDKQKIGRSVVGANTKRVTPEIGDRILSLYSQGMGGLLIGRLVGFSKTTVYNVLKRRGIKTRCATVGTASLERKAGPGTRRFAVYTVYAMKEDELPIIVDGYADECAEAMGITIGNFYRYYTMQQSPKYKPVKKWYIEKRALNGRSRDDLPDEDEDPEDEK